MSKLIVTLAVAVPSLVGISLVGAVSTSGQVAQADTGLELEWGTGAAPRYLPARWKGAAFSQSRGSGPLYELRWGNGRPPVLVRIEAD